MHDLDDVPQMNQIAFALAPGLHAGVEVGKTVVSRMFNNIFWYHFR